MKTKSILIPFLFLIASKITKRFVLFSIIGNIVAVLLIITIKDIYIIDDFFIWIYQKSSGLDIFNLTLNKLTVLSIIEISENILRIVFPISIAFIYFVYREQAVTSIKNQNNLYILFYINSIICFTFLSWRLNFELKYGDSSGELIQTLVTLWIFSMGAVATFLVFNISKPLADLNTKKVYKKLNRKFERNAEYLYYCKLKFLRNHLFSYLIETVRTISQTIEYSHNTNLKTVHARQLASYWDSFQSYMDEFPSNSKSKSAAYINKFLELDLEKTKELYALLVEKHGEQILLQKKLDNAQQKERLMALFEYEPTNAKELYEEFYQEINEFSMKYTEESDNIMNFLQKLRSISGVNSANVFKIKDQGSQLIHQNLLAKALQKQNLNHVTEIINSLTESVLQEGNKEFSISLDGKIFKYRISVPSTQSLDYNRCFVLFILLTAAYETIEKGYYNGTGFIVKRIFSEFKHTELEGALKAFFTYKGDLINYINNTVKSATIGIIPKGLETNFIIKESSFKYCSQKMLIILFLQHNLVINFPIKHCVYYDQDASFNTDQIDIKYVNYIREKLVASKNLYGLISISNEKLFEEYISKLVIDEKPKEKV